MVHLREDRRHIIDSDVESLLKEIKVDLNLEMAATEEMLKIALRLKPYSICIVPEKREERTTEGGLDLSGEARQAFLKRICLEARAAGIVVSFFIEPDAKDVTLSHQLGAHAVELHTGSLCTAIQLKKPEIGHEWQRVKTAAAEGARLGLMVHAGHGIDYEIAPELSQVLEFIEYNIGHSIVSEAVFCGLREATMKMKNALKIGAPLFIK